MIDVLKIASMSKLMQFKPNEVIIPANGPISEYLYAVLAGNAAEYRGYSFKNNGQKVCDFSYGESFGEVSFFCNLPSATTFLAVDNVTLVAIDRMSFITICQTSPENACEIVCGVAEKLSLANDAVIQFKTITETALKKLGTDMETFTKQLLFPPLHKSVDIKEPESFAEFLSPYEVTCPSCKSKFMARTQLTSKLRPMNDEMQRADMRKKYVNFEPLWYDVTSCPHCLFSAQTVNFSKSIDLARNTFAKSLEDTKSKVNPVFTYPKTVEQVFMSYYIALICSDGMENPSQVKGRLWLQLSWLYSDINQQEMVRYAHEKAYDAYSDFYSVSTLDPISTQVCCLILGSLAGSLGLYEEAMAHLYQVKAQRDGKPIYKTIADRESDIIREDHKAKQASQQ